MKILIHFVFFISATTFGQNPVDTLIKPEVRYLVDSATHLMRSGNYEKALSIYEKIVLIDSTSILLYSNKKALEGLLRRYDRAVLSAQRLVELNPDDAYYNFSAGVLYEKIGDKINGGKYLLKAINQCDKILDTLNRNNSFTYETTKLTRALAVFFCGNEVLGNELLVELFKEKKENQVSAVYPYLNKSKEELFAVWFGEK